MSEKIKIVIDPDLEDLIPTYIDNRLKDIKTLESSLLEKNYESIRMIGHKIKGNSLSYGFVGLDVIAKALEEGAKSKDSGVIEQKIKEMVYYFNNIELVKKTDS